MIRLFEAYAINIASPLQVTLVNEVSNGIEMFQSPTFWDRRKNLNGLTFKVGAIHAPPVMYMDDLSPPKGYNFEILNTLAEELNFTYEFYVPQQKTFGTIDANGRWTGK